MKNYPVIVILLLLGLLPMGATAEVPTFKLGGAFALTGDAATFGTQELKGAQLAVAEIESEGKLKLDLMVEDTGSSAAGTVTAVQKLIDFGGVRFVVGPTWLDSFQGPLPIAARRNTVLITPSAGISNIKKSPSDYPLVFSSFFNFEREIAFLVEHVAATGAKRVAIVFDQDPYFQAMRGLALAAAYRLKLDVVADYDLPSGGSDFRSVLLKLKSKTPDACILGLSNQGSVLAFLKQRHELFPALRIVGTHDFDGYNQNPGLTPLLVGIEYGVPREASSIFKQAFKVRYGTDPMLSASNAYDAVMLFVGAFREGRTEATAVADFIKNTNFHSASFGETRFSPLGGIETGDFVIKRW